MNHDRPITSLQYLIESYLNLPPKFKNTAVRPSHRHSDTVMYSVLKSSWFILQVSGASQPAAIFHVSNKAITNYMARSLRTPQYYIHVIVEH